MGLLAVLTVTAPAASAVDTVRVGIYSNPPKVFLTEDGEPSGLWPELTRLIAEQEGWEIEWVHGSWDQSLTRLHDNRIDVMVDVALTEARRERFIFGEETVHVSWSEVHTRPGTRVETIPDLADMRIGVLRDSINVDGPEGLRTLLDRFAVDAELVIMPDYGSVFRALEEGRVDAAVTNRNFGHRARARFDVVRTPILFQPADLRYAFAPQGEHTAELIRRFDTRLAALKQDSDSAYYGLLERWVGDVRDTAHEVFPIWLRWVIGALVGVAVLLAGGLALVEMRVRARTREISAQKAELERHEAMLADLAESRRTLINSLPAQIALLDREGVIRDVNDEWRRFGADHEGCSEGVDVGANYLAVCDRASGVCGGESKEVARGIRDVLAGRQDNFGLEYPCHAPERQRWFRVTANRLVAGDHGCDRHGVVVMHVDVTERKVAEQELSRLAYEDPLTGLRSRNGFVHELAERIRRDGWQTAGIVVALDVIGLRDINDAHGYDAGDQLLVGLADRLREVAGDHGLAGRTGGDEFVLFLTPVHDEELAARLQELSAALSASLVIDGSRIEMRIRLGYTRLGHQRRTEENLLREAELALFQNREEMGASWSAYTEEVDRAEDERIRITRELRTSLEEQQFELHFQPKVDLGTGRLLGCEALLRWNHPERGLQPPDLFIPIAEKSRLIGPIGDWVLRDACRQLRAWQAAGLGTIPISINVSLVQFMAGDFPRKVQAALAEFGIEPAVLRCEITESVFERESDALLAQLRELHALGVGLSLDDFGTGYSSLLYLQRYPFDEIKVDQQFVRYILDDSYSREIVGMVMGLARAFNAEVVAEGIETAAIRDALIELGCRSGQGYFYSRPVDAAAFASLIETHDELPAAESRSG